MRIALVLPKSRTFSNDPAFQRFAAQSLNWTAWRSVFSGSSVALPLLAALTPAGHHVSLVNENCGQSMEGIDADLVGISVMTQNAVRAYEMADGLRSKGVKVVLGGIHATVLPDEAKEHADAVVVGEAEGVWPSLVADVERGVLKPFYNGPAADLAASPMPRHDLLAPGTTDTIWIQTTRGCPHDCEFCAASKVFGAKYRTKPIEQVIQEVRRVAELYPHARIGFADDNMLTDRPRAKRLLKELSGVGIRYHAQADASVADDPEILDMLRDSGCVFVVIGFESVSKSALASLNRNGWKARQRENYEHCIDALQSRGIGVQGAFIIGHDSDDAESVAELGKFVVDAKMFETQITILTPTPGTRLRARLESEGRLLPTSWDNYTFMDVNFVPKNFTKTELEGKFLELCVYIDSHFGYLDKMAHFKRLQRGRIAKETKRAASDTCAV